MMVCTTMCVHEKGRSESFNLQLYFSASQIKWKFGKNSWYEISYSLYRPDMCISLQLIIVFSQNLKFLLLIFILYY